MSGRGSFIRLDLDGIFFRRIDVQPLLPRLIGNRRPPNCENLIHVDVGISSLVARLAGLDGCQRRPEDVDLSTVTVKTTATNVTGVVQLKLVVHIELLGQLGAFIKLLTRAVCVDNVDTDFHATVRVLVRGGFVRVDGIIPNLFANRRVDANRVPATAEPVRQDNMKNGRIDRLIVSAQIFDVLVHVDFSQQSLDVGWRKCNAISHHRVFRFCVANRRRSPTVTMAVPCWRPRAASEQATQEPTGLTAATTFLVRSGIPVLPSYRASAVAERRIVQPQRPGSAALPIWVIVA